jgi:hypothetical protein
VIRVGGIPASSKKELFLSRHPKLFEIADKGPQIFRRHTQAGNHFAGNNPKLQKFDYRTGSEMNIIAESFNANMAL